MFLENVKSVSIVNDDFVYLRYNGSWNIIQHESTDGKDYSFAITSLVIDSAWEMFYNDIEEGMVEESDELPNHYFDESLFMFIDMCDDYNVEITK